MTINDNWKNDRSIINHSTYTSRGWVTKVSDQCSKVSKTPAAALYLRSLATTIINLYRSHLWCHVCSYINAIVTSARCSPSGAQRESCKRKKCVSWQKTCNQEYYRYPLKINFVSCSYWIREANSFRISINRMKYWINWFNIFRSINILDKIVKIPNLMSLGFYINDKYVFGTISATRIWNCEFFGVTGLRSNFLCIIM